MKILSRYFVFQFILVLTVLSCNSQTINQKVLDKNGREKLLGKVTIEAFTEPSFESWFNPNYENYIVDQKTLKSLKKKLATYEIKAFMGTWCGDSKREIPKFYKILEEVDYPKDKLTMVAVDYIKPNYKKSPGGEEKGLNIIKVPTFIFFKDGKEVNRIVESPIETLEKDMDAIVQGKKYVPNYNDLPVLLPQD